MELLRLRDPKWVTEQAARLGKTSKELVFDDIRDQKFGEFTASRLSSVVERDFLVCFPLSVADKRWKANDYLTYLTTRAQKPKVNAKLARDRIHPIDLGTLCVTVFWTMPFCITAAMSFYDPSIINVIFMLVSSAFLIPVIDTIWSNISYSKLAKRIEQHAQVSEIG
jgi:hypothetical protein